jgi:hypothetical protein
MYYLVYLTTNKVNGKFYIGCHATHDKNDGYLGSGKLLKRAILKYGILNFKREILLEASSVEEMLSKEKELVVLGPQSYNLKSGGLGGFAQGVSKLGGRSNKGKSKSEEMKRKNAQTHVGMRHSVDVREKMRNARVGNPSPNKGKKWTTERRERQNQLNRA